MRILRDWPILSLDRLAEILTHQSPPLDSVMVTFDDGYANNLEAVEYLASRDIPSAVFITAGHISTESTIWTIELALLLLHGGSTRVEVLDRPWDLASSEVRAASFRAIRQQMKSLPSTNRMQEMENLRQQFPPGRTKELLERFPAFRMLSWDAVRHMQSLKCTIGSHGVHHEIHHGNQPTEIREAELANSRRQIEATTNSLCRYFAFPNGNTNPQSDAELRQAGYILGLTTIPETVSAAANPFRIPRFDAPSNPSSLFRILTWKRSTESS